MKIVDCVKLQERKDFKMKWSEKRERRRERRNKEETKRNIQGCDRVFLACAFLLEYSSPNG